MNNLRGCRVAVFDASPELAALVGVHIWQEVATLTFSDVVWYGSLNFEMRITKRIG